MNDPHVESLTYRMETNSEVVRFENPPPLVHETAAFRLRLEDGVLTVEMKEHYPTVQQARTCVESYLKDWTLFSALEFDVMLMDFIFATAHQIDRNPPLPAQATGEAHLVGDSATMQAYGTVTPLVRKAYPTPPSGFKTSPDVETMWFRYRQHIDGKEPLASMAYFCLSVLQWSTGSKRATQMAAQMYNIDKDILDDLGELTSQRGTPSEARKLDTKATKPRHNYRYTSAEIN